MKEFAGIARNLMLVIDEQTGEGTPSVELVFTVSEPKPVFEDDDLVAVREFSDLRMAASVAGLKMIALTVLEIVESIKRLEMVERKVEDQEGGEI
jgi:hypothetical protein